MGRKVTAARRTEPNECQKFFLFPNSECLQIPHFPEVLNKGIQRSPCSVMQKLPLGLLLLASTLWNTCFLFSWRSENVLVSILTTGPQGRTNVLPRGALLELFVHFLCNRLEWHHPGHLRRGHLQTDWSYGIHCHRLLTIFEANLQNTCRDRYPL